MKNRLTGTLTFLFLAAVLGPAQQPAAMPQATIEAKLRSALDVRGADPTLDLLMLGDEYSGTAPSRPRWEIFAPRAHFQWRKFDDETRDWVFDRSTMTVKRREIDDEERAPLENEVIWYTSRALGLWNKSGDVHLVRTADSSVRRIFDTSASETALGWAIGDKEWYFRRGDDVFARAVDTGIERQVLAIGGSSDSPPRAARGRANRTSERRAANDDSATSTRSSDGEEKTKKVTADGFRKAEEESLLRIIAEKAKREAAVKARRERIEVTEKRIVTFSPPRGLDVRSTHVSPSLGWAAIVCGARPADSARTADMPQWITDDGYVAMTPTRSKVGSEQEREELWIVDLHDGTSQKVEFPIETEAVQLGPVLMSPKGGAAAVVLHGNDNKDEWLAIVDAGVSAARIVHRVHDDAWVYNFANSIGFLPGESKLWFLSESSGWSHLYLHDLDRNETTPLTSGAYEVSNVSFLSVLDAFLIHSSEVSPYERHAYLMARDGSSIERLTFAQGAHDVSIAPDGAWLIDLHSTAVRPWELYLRRLHGDAEPGLALTTSPSPAFLSHTWQMPEVIEFDARDGARVPARLYRPSKPLPHRPAVVFVHGAGYLQNVHRWWSRYSREYMFHNLLCERGYHVIDIDYRGSAGHGRDWRVGIYRAMGGKDLDDQVDGARWLAANCGVSPRHIGIYGGSYGGFITLMAMFKEPGTFAAGAALRPVTDWAHYNHGYTSNILNNPQDEADVYRASSPIYHAQGLEGHLLICHGMVDDNVHFQDSVRLVQRLIELRKENWEFAIYPAEAHGFTDAASWADEYRRILKLFEGVLGRP